MAVPSFQNFFRPILEFAEEGEVRYRDAIVRAADYFELSEEDRDEKIPSGKNTRVGDRVSWAISYLLKAGLIQRPRRASFAITEEGRKTLRTAEGKIDTEFLMQFKKFRDFKNPQSSSSNESDDVKGENNTAKRVVETPESTPQERIDLAHDEIDAALNSDILDRVLNLDPKDFEQLIIDLMNAMDYGAGGESKRIGKAGDGGVDGVISEDKLGLDVVYLQAKRYAPENSIGPEQVRGFIGALSIRRASKGVFVTTSRFTEAAIEETRMSGQRVILIDGKQLAALMIQYGVGVRVTSTVLIKEIDLNYFDDF